jgi:hypothetical protein
MLGRGHNWLLMHLIATFEQFNAYEATNSTSDHRRSGRPRVTMQSQGRYILRHHLQYRFATAAQAARQTIGIHQRSVSDDTIRRRLAVNNLACRRPAKGPICTPRHRQERLQWATDRRN